MHFLLPGDPYQISGGYLYDRRIVDALRGLGWRVTIHGIEGGFPDVDAATRSSAKDTFDRLPIDSLVVVDGLALGALPEIAAAQRERLRLVALVHHPLADETGLDAERRRHLAESERAALASARRVITTSAFTAKRLAAFDLAPEKVAVVTPGADPAPLARGSGGSCPSLLCVANLIPRKGHDLLVAALARLADRPWHCLCVGSLDASPAYAERVARQIRRLGLGDRIELLGQRSPQALAALYDGADLFVLASHYEGYGMVLSEATARGLPIVATAGGAVATTVAEDSALLSPAGDLDAFTAALANVLDDPSRRDRLGDAARQARTTLPDWNDAGRRFATALTECLS